jgi:chorismate synthase
MKVGDLVQMKPQHQRELREIAEYHGKSPGPALGIVVSIEEPRANGDYIQLHNRPYPAHADYFEVIHESR